MLNLKNLGAGVKTAHICIAHYVKVRILRNNIRVKLTTISGKELNSLMAPGRNEFLWWSAPHLSGKKSLTGAAVRDQYIGNGQESLSTTVLGCDNILLSDTTVRVQPNPHVTRLVD